MAAGAAAVSQSLHGPDRLPGKSALLLLMRSLPLVLSFVLIAAARPLAAQEPPPAEAPSVQGPALPAPAPAPVDSPAQAPGPSPEPPRRLPPPDSPPLVRFIEIAFPTQGNVSVIEPQTYQYYIHTLPSRSSEGTWVPYDEASVLADFKRLWGTNFLDNIWIDVKDAPYDNGVVGKHIVYNLEERQRVKIVDYIGADSLDQSNIDEALKERSLAIRLDSFIDPGLIKRVQGVILEMLAEKGYEFAEVKPEVKPLPGGPKTVHLSFVVTEGPKVKIREIEFVGNKDISDGKLRSQMKSNKQVGFFSFITGNGTYQEAKFEEDAEAVVAYYRERGYVAVQVGQPELKYLEDSADKETRWMQLRIPVTEGERYRIGDITFEGNKVIRLEALQALFQQRPGSFYSEKRMRTAFDKARELYGSVGYFEFTGYPDLKPREQPQGDGQIEDVPEMIAEGKPTRVDGSPLVDIVVRLNEGEQYFVNRITFVGNTTTRDNVIRREMRLVENGVFNTEALKYSVRRLNQLGYFKPLEDQRDITVEKTPGQSNKVDVSMKFEEQNRNQLTFGAGVSQFEGFFGQLSFVTSNFLGRGESLTLSLQAGSRAKNYQVAFSEPFLFDRPITGGVDIYDREIRYPEQFTQASSGGNVVMGFPLADFTRMFVSYGYEQVRVEELNPIFLDPVVLSRNPFLRDSLLIGQGGRRTVSKVTPSVAMNTVDNPIFPSSGKRYTAVVEMAGLGGNTSFYKPRVEGVWFIPHTRRTSIGLRAEAEYIGEWGRTIELPIFEKLFLGGGFSVRGYDIRSIGPRDEETGLVLGGNKSLLFNAEYLITIAQPVRLVFFYDAGQVLDKGQNFAMDEFITSTGAEVRFFMPVLNVPFRLIMAFNPQRDGVLDNNLQPEKAFKFRFDVGSTF
jgi:outer membrane protein insertion porin family